ncbi:MAG TPA: SDR family NAD(P)-dependent oxidoreductase [Nocardioidaceae bacterium]|nr:SDR family NAD(P)-dependent oxidoreductase [Nocardioidaceae bacterium]
MTVDLQGARVLLTGATGGLGHAIARALHAKGATLTLTGRRLDVLEPLAKELGASSIAADLSSMASIGAVLEEAGDVDVLIANAALPGTGLLESYTIEQIDTNLAVNLRAPIVMTKAVLPQMLARGAGHVVYIGSVSGITSSPGSAMYNATKFGLRGFSNALRQDLHGSGVGVSIVMPSFVRDAGMAVEGGLIDALPPGVRTVTPEQVAKGVIRAIRRNKGQVVVAPREQRIGATIGSVIPELGGAVQRLSGAADISAGHKGPKT